MPKKVKETEIQIVFRKGAAVVVEWVGTNGLQRGVLPAEAVKPDGTVNPDDLLLASPYGLPFESLVKARTVTPERIAQALRTAGIWTLEDVRRESRLIPAILQGVYGLDMAALINEIEAGVSQQEAK